MRDVARAGIRHRELDSHLCSGEVAKIIPDIEAPDQGEVGGRLDATNVCTPSATAVTTIELEHTKLLGDTLERLFHNTPLRPLIDKLVAR